MSSDQLFPRGGGGNVSASSNEASATSESLFGTSDKKRRRETSKIAKKSIKQQRLKKKKSSSSKPQREMYDRELELSFDDLTIGSAFLGRVRSIQEDGSMLVDLVRGMIGVVKTPVHKYVKTGDYVRVAVVSLDPSRNGIELTDSPSALNSAAFASGLSHLTKGNRVFGEVLSVEDHGYVIKFTHNVTGFLPFKNFVSERRLKKFEAITALVDSVNLETRVVTLTCKQKETIYHDDGDISMSQLFPGMLVRVDVRAERLNGYRTKLLNTFDAGLNILDVIKENDDDEITLHDKFTTRIVYCDLNSKTILVSALSSVTSLQNEEIEFEIGTILQDAVVVRTIPSKGLILSHPKLPEMRLYCPLSKITDDTKSTRKKKRDVLKLKPYALLSKHRVRVVKFDSMSSMMLADMRLSVLELPYYSFDEIKIGALISQCVVDSVLAKGLVVRVGGSNSNITGFVSLYHLNDAVVLKSVPSKFRKGSKLACRVLSKSGRKNLQLTAKPTLVNMNEDQVITSWEEITKQGQQVTGFITKVLERTIYVTLFGNVHGACVVSEDENYCVGQVLQVFVRNVRPLRFCLRENDIASGVLKVGSVVSLDRVLERVGEIGHSSDSLVVSVGKTKAILPVTHLSDRRITNTSLENLKRYFTDELLVVKRFANTSKHFGCEYMVTAKQSIIHQRDTLALLKQDSLSSNEDVLNGFVEYVSSKGMYVHFLNNVSGYVEKQEISCFDQVDPRELFARGDSVRVRVLGNKTPDNEENKTTTLLSVRSVLEDEKIDLYVDLGRCLEEENFPKELEIGTQVEARVKEIHSAYTVLSLSSIEDMIGVCLRKSSNSNLVKGAVVKARVLHVDFEKRVVDLTLTQLEEKIRRVKSGTSVSMIVELVTTHYAVTTLPKRSNQLALIPLNRNSGLKLAIGERVRGKVLKSARDASKGIPQSVLVCALTNSKALEQSRRSRAGSFSAQQSASSVVPGSEVSVQIKEVLDSQINVRVLGVKGYVSARVHITNIESPPKSRDFKLKDLPVVDINQTFETCHVLSNKDFAQGSNGQRLELSLVPEAKTTTDQWGIVISVSEMNAIVALSPTERGSLFLLDAVTKSDLNKKWRKMTESFQVGMWVPIRVIRRSGKRIDLALDTKDTVLNVCAIRGLNNDEDEHSSAISLSVQISRTEFGRVDIIDFASLKDHELVNGMLKECKVLKRQGRMIDVALMRKEKTRTKLPKKGDQVVGYVVDIARKLVRIGRSMTGMIQHEISKIQLGQKVSVVVNHVKGKNKISLSLANHANNKNKRKRDDDVENKNKKRHRSELVEGLITHGSVKRVEKWGVFVTLSEFRCDALCHISEISDDKTSKDIRLKVGDLVRCKVLKIAGRRKISIGLKQSYFESIGDDVDDDDDKEDKKEKDEDVMDTEESEEEEEEDEEEEEEEEKEEMRTRPTTTNVLSVASLFGTKSDMGTESDIEDEDDEEEDTKTSTTKLTKKEIERITELEENRRLLENQLPSNNEDFERLLLENPNSVYLYVQYIAFLISRTEIERARQLGERAIRNVNFPNEQAKLNLYLSLLNLESKFGDKQTLNDIYRRACSACAPIPIWKRYVHIHIESQNHDRVENLLKMGVKKFKNEVEVWKFYIRYVVTTKKSHKEAKALLKRALLVLPQHQHVSLIEYLGKCEFEFGSKNRGITIFEGLITSHPKRWDIWSRYIDMLARDDDHHDKTRALFQRVQSQKWSSKRMKALYKKWYDFEQKIDGDVEKVAELARQYIQGLDKKEDEEEDESSSSDSSDSSDSDSSDSDDDDDEDDE